jgi:peptide/nickel transport system substrate-binding protein
LPEFDGKLETALLAKALAATPQEEDAAYHAIALQLIADKIVFTILSPDLVLAHRADISGVYYSACCNLRLADIVKH